MHANNTMKVLDRVCVRMLKECPNSGLPTEHFQFPYAIHHSPNTNLLHRDIKLHTYTPNPVQHLTTTTEIIAISSADLSHRNQKQCPSKVLNAGAKPSLRHIVNIIRWLLQTPHGRALYQTVSTTPSNPRSSLMIVLENDYPRPEQSSHPRKTGSRNQLLRPQCNESVVSPSVPSIFI